MSGFAAENPNQENWEGNQDNALSAKQRLSLHKSHLQQPIDETEEFHDPFSDLSLFLTRKIKREITKRGGTKKWNQQIQSDLISNILPEFKRVFPKYRLGISALKKTWEKISFYQKKIANIKQAFLANGKLNIEYLIKENIRNCQKNLPGPEFHPYSQAQSLALNLAECVATIDGELPKIHQLTKTIWAVQKQLLDQALPKSSSPIEETKPLDKLILKTMLGIINQKPHLTQRKLALEVRLKCLTLTHLNFLSNLESLSNMSCMLAASKIIAHRQLLTCFDIKEKQNIESFLSNHINRSSCKIHPEVINRLSMVQKILALYSLAPVIPKNVDEETLLYSAQKIYEEKKQAFLVENPSFDPVLYAFIKTEILLHKEQKSYSWDFFQQSIIEAYQEICQLPSLQERQMEDVEILLWHLIDQRDSAVNTLSGKELQLINEEANSIIVDLPQYSFSALHQSLVQLFKSLRKMAVDKNLIDEKIHYLTLQNDIVYRYLHFESSDRFLQIIHELHQNGYSFQSLVEAAVEKIKKERPTLSTCFEELYQRAWILYKYFWYTRICKNQNPLEAFILWHLRQSRTKGKTAEELYQTLSSILPLTPFQKKDIEKIIADQC